MFESSIFHVPSSPFPSRLNPPVGRMAAVHTPSPFSFHPGVGHLRAPLTAGLRAV